MVTKAKDNGDEVVEDKPMRLSITIDPSLRKAIRIASAWADLEPGEWCVRTLKAAAMKAVPELEKKGTRS